MSIYESAEEKWNRYVKYYKELDRHKSLIDTECLQGIIYHLEELEKITGKPLLTSARDELTTCPMWLYAPEYDSSGYKLYTTTVDGYVVYRYQNDREIVHRYKIYTHEDSVWWNDLTYYFKEAYLAFVDKWVSHRDIIEEA